MMKPRDGGSGRGMQRCWWELLDFRHLLKVEPWDLLVDSTNLEWQVVAKLGN